MAGLCKRAGIRRFGLHSLRRHFASIMADEHKESLPVIQKLLGHKSIQTTERYIRLISGDVERAVNKITFDIPEGLLPTGFTDKEKGSQLIELTS